MCRAIRERILLPPSRPFGLNGVTLLSLWSLASTSEAPHARSTFVRLGRVRACPSCSACATPGTPPVFTKPVRLNSSGTFHRGIEVALRSLLGDAILGRRLVVCWAEEPDRSLCILRHRAVVDTPPLEDAGAAGGWICREEIQEIDRAHRHPRCRRAARRATRAAPAATPGRGEGREASLVGECGARAARDGAQAA
jgi:hypothetical protein